MSPQSGGRARILVVDDEAPVRGLVRALLERERFSVIEAEEGHAALRALYAEHPDLVLLDVTMPGLSGWDTLERIRDFTDIPILMLTGRDAELEKVRALRAGADDYMTKPFGRQELLARVDALLRRSRARVQPDETYADDLLTIDFARREVRVSGREVSLTPLEFRLLTAFVRHPEQVLGRDQILDLVWGDEAGVSAAQVKLYVGYLRRKLGFEDPKASPIVTVRGFGYRYRRTLASDTA